MYVRSELYEIHRYPDVDALKLWKGRSGTASDLSQALIIHDIMTFHGNPVAYLNYSFNNVRNKITPL